VPYPQRFAQELTATVRRGLDGPALRATLDPALHDLIGDPRVPGARRFVLTGSGDSLFAAMSVRPALRRWSGQAVDVLTALELGRYEVPLLGPGDVVLGISNSGSSTRTREALTLARERGALTVAVVGSRSGPLAGLAERVLHRPVGALEGVDSSRARVYVNCGWSAGRGGSRRSSASSTTSRSTPTSGSAAGSTSRATGSRTIPTVGPEPRLEPPEHHARWPRRASKSAATASSWASSPSASASA
jgi:hypothetical protein